MAQPIYKVFMLKYTDAWYRLTPEEQAAHTAKLDEALKQVGGERVMMRVSVWSAEKWLGWGVEKFPSIEAVQQFAQLLFSMKHYQYIECESYLGVEMPEG